MAAIDRIKELLEQQLGATMQTAPADGSMWRRKRQADEAFIAQPIAQKEGSFVPVDPSNGVTIQSPKTEPTTAPEEERPAMQEGMDARSPIVPQMPQDTMMAKPESPIGSPIQTLGGTVPDDPNKIVPQMGSPESDELQKAQAQGMSGNQPFNQQYSQEQVDGVLAQRNPNNEKDPRVRQERLIADGVPKQNSFWKRFGGGALRGLANGGVLGALTGGIIEGMSPEMNQEARKQQSLNRVAPQVEAMNKQEDQQMQVASNQARIDTIKVDDERQAANLERQVKRDEVKAQLDQDKLDFNVDTANKLQVWRERKLDADIKGDDVKAKLAQQRIDELIRSNKAKEGLAKDQEQGRNSRAQVANNLKLAMEQYKTAVAAKQSLEAEEAKKRVLQFQQELENAQ